MDDKVQHAINAINNLSVQPIDKLKNHITAYLCSLTGSTVAFFGTVTPDEDTMTIIGFSAGAMTSCSMVDKPVVYKVGDTGLWGDPVRDRKAVIVNDYEHLVKSTKRGYPAGHVKIKKFMGVPIWNGSKMVLLVGVGNKKDEYNPEDINHVEIFMAEVWKLIGKKL